MPSRLVTSAKSGLRMSGRKVSLELQQLLDIAGEDFHLVLLAERDVRDPLDRGLVLDERGIDRENDPIDAQLLHAAHQRRVREEAARRDIEMLAEELAEIERLVARPRQRRVDAPQQERQPFAQM